MPTNIEPLSKLPEPDNLTLRILVFLLREGATSKSSVYFALERSNKTIQPRIDKLVEIGLVKETPIEKPYGKKMMELTPKGRQVAEKLGEIEKILEA